MYFISCLITRLIHSLRANYKISTNTRVGYHIRACTQTEAKSKEKAQDKITHHSSRNW